MIKVTKNEENELIIERSSERKRKFTSMIYFEFDLNKEEKYLSVYHDDDFPGVEVQINGGLFDIEDKESTLTVQFHKYEEPNYLTFSRMTEVDQIEYDKKYELGECKEYGNTWYPVQKVSKNIRDWEYSTYKSVSRIRKVDFVVDNVQDFQDVNILTVE